MNSLPPRKALSVVPFSQWIVKQIDALIACPDAWRQCRMLQELRPYVWCDTFSYRLKESELTAKQALLRLWDTMLSLVDRVPHSQRPLCYAAIVRLMARYEFDLVHLPAPLPDASSLELALFHAVR